MANLNEFIQGSKQSVLGYLDTVKEHKRRQQEQREIAPMARHAPGGLIGSVALVLGAVLLAVVCALMVVNLFLYKISPVSILGVAFIPLIFGLFLVVWGYNKNRQARFYDEYKTFFEKKPYVKITTLAKETRASVSATTSRLTKFKHLGLYPEGFFTKNKAYFVLSGRAKEIMEADLERQEELRQQREQEEILKNDYPVFSEVEEQIEDSLKHIKKSKKSGGKMDKDLAGISSSLVHIRDYLKKNPDQIASARTFLNYFLPTTDRLLNTYSELENEVQTPNVVQARRDIESVLSSLNKAYKNMYNDFYTQTAIDVYSDVTVLETMIKREYPD